MKTQSDVGGLAALFSGLARRTRHAWSDLGTPALAADAVYDLRLGLRISRILRHFLRRDPAFLPASSILDQAYRATSRVRDRQVGVELIRALEQGWPRNRRRPSTALAQTLRRAYPELRQTVGALGLDAALDSMQTALVTLEQRTSRKKLRRRASRHACKLDHAMLKAMRRALDRQRMRDWHRLRLTIKQFRFWVDSLEDWLPARLGERARALKPLQVALGDVHDCEVLAAWLEQVPGAPLDRWLPALAARKDAARQRAQAALRPLLERAGKAH